MAALGFATIVAIVGCANKPIKTETLMSQIDSDARSLRNQRMNNRAYQKVDPRELSGTFEDKGTYVYQSASFGADNPTRSDYSSAIIRACQKMNGNLKDKFCRISDEVSGVVFFADAWTSDKDGKSSTVVDIYVRKDSESPEFSSLIRRKGFKSDAELKHSAYLTEYSRLNNISGVVRKYDAYNRFKIDYSSYDPNGYIDGVKKFLNDNFDDYQATKKADAERERVERENRRIREENQQREKERQIALEIAMVKKPGTVICTKGTGTQDPEFTYARTRIRGRVFFDYYVKGTVENFNGNQISIRVTSIKTVRTSLSYELMQLQPVTGMPGPGHTEFPREIMGDPAFILGGVTWDSPKGWKPC